MALLFLGFKNYRLRSHEEGLEAVGTFCGQGGSWESNFRDFVLMSFWTALYLHLC